MTLNEKDTILQRKIYIKPYDRMVEDIVREIGTTIILDPDYERNYIWKNDKASKLIESILLNIPIPVIYASEDEKGKWIIIDGLQRLHSIERFFKNDFKLINLETLSYLNGKNFTSLDESIRSQLNRGELRIILLQKESDSKIKYDIFMRLNQGAISLNQQELRNCLYRGKLNDLIKRISEEDEYSKKIFLTKSNRMIINETILRYFSFSENYDKNKNEIQNYDGRIKNFLNCFMEKHINPSDDFLVKIKANYFEQIKKAFSIYGKFTFKTDYKKNTTKINSSLYDCVMISFEDYSFDDLLLHKAGIINMTNDLIDEPDFNNSITKSTGNTIEINYRISTFIRKLREVMNGEF